MGFANAEQTSYVDGARVSARERRLKIAEIVDTLGRIVSGHATFGERTDREPPRLAIPPVQWASTVTARLELFDPDGRPVYGIGSLAVTPERAAAVTTASFFMKADEEVEERVMTIQTSPPQVTGFDGAPLSPAEIDGAVDDMHRYEQALGEGALAQPAAETVAASPTFPATS